MASQRPSAIDFNDHARALRHRSDKELRVARFVLSTIQRPLLMRAGILAARTGLALRIPGTVSAIERTVFQLFCGGTTLEEALESAERLHELNIGTILDYAVEGGEDDDDAETVTAEILRALRATGAREEQAYCAIKLTGVARFDLLEKMNAGATLSEDEQAEFLRVQNRLNAMAECARDNGGLFFVDAEHSWVQDVIDDEVERLMATYNREEAIVHHTVQLYLRTGLPYLAKAIERAREGGYKLGVKLVRGAYLEQENERAEERGVETRVQPSKAATDHDYDAATTLCLENLDIVRVCVATHNVGSVQHLIAEMDRLGIACDDPRVSASQLLGMFDRITIPLAEAGYQVLKYIPYGEVRSAFPYMLRRADENRSIAQQLATELKAINLELKRRRSSAKTAA